MSKEESNEDRQKDDLIERQGECEHNRAVKYLFHDISGYHFRCLDCGKLITRESI
jgi:hypothetical protein